MRNHIDLFIDLIVLLKDVLLRRVESRLKRHKHLNHELRILSVRPVIDVRLEVRPVASWLTILLLHPEMYLKQVNEVGEEEAPINVSSDVIRQLRHEPLVNLLFNRIVLVVGPVVLKIPLKSLGHFFG